MGLCLPMSTNAMRSASFPRMRSDASTWCHSLAYARVVYTQTVSVQKVKEIKWTDIANCLRHDGQRPTLSFDADHSTLLLSLKNNVETFCVFDCAALVWYKSCAELSTLTQAISRLSYAHRWLWGISELRNSTCCSRGFQGWIQVSSLCFFTRYLNNYEKARGLRPGIPQ